MIPTPARYLLRFDDLCPTIHAQRWQQCRSLIEEFCLQPILAVVPDNRDADLKPSSPDPAFWNQLHALESAGATIGLHGYRHLCESTGCSLLGLQRTSEFAGVPAETQRRWIREGLEILRGHGLDPRIFVAPRHGFDAHTLQAMCSEDISLLSDGFARVPHLRDGVTWIPQQLWGPAQKTAGVWTICTHPNTASKDEVAQLRNFLRAHSAQFTSVDRLLAEYPPAPLPRIERIYADISLWRFKASRAARSFLRLALRSSRSA